MNRFANTLLAVLCGIALLAVFLVPIEGNGPSPASVLAAAYVPAR